MMELTSTYWNNRYAEGSTGWDLKEVSPPIKAYLDQLENKELKILIPGGGYSYEAQYCWEQGFKNVSVVDFSQLALENLKQRVPDFPSLQLIQEDFFTYHGQFDVIIEQTFFCALQPDLRPAYVAHMHTLLKAKGKLVGLLFNFPLTEKGPPYGGSTTAYENLFSEHFDIQKMETSYNSVAARADKELFIKMVKK